MIRSPRKRQYAFRLPPELIDRVDIYASMLKDKLGAEVSRTTAVTGLLAGALARAGLPATALHQYSWMNPHFSKVAASPGWDGLSLDQKAHRLRDECMVKRKDLVAELREWPADIWPRAVTMLQWAAARRQAERRRQRSH